MPKLLDLQFPAGCERLPEGFWSSVDVWTKKPHVLNKRLCGAKETDGETVAKVVLQDLLEDPELSQTVVAFLGKEVSEHQETWRCTIRTIIPKVSCCGSNLHKELVVRDSHRQRVTFLPFEEDAEGRQSLKRSNIYQIQLVNQDCQNWTMELHVLTPDLWFSDGVVYPNLGWLSSDLLPKLLRWASECKTSEFKSTLSLLPLEKYSLMYQRLKDKYKAMVKVWPEVTDPEKFVYEDVAIATYLLVLWEEERVDKGLADRQSFVDLGCGNGLLVHILTNEGHPGKGMDVRRRKIWHMYGPQTLLEEKAITPDESLSLAGTDWLIGNHSDELTPWIPVMAARSSYYCRYFVLPCCFFDFYGKYQRRQCQKSQYKEYIDFITEVSEKSGFNTQEDCLRIPSTKRVCLVGASRNYLQSDEDQAEQCRAHYIQTRRVGSTAGVKVQGSCAPNKADMSEMNQDSAVGNPRSGWGAGFRPRDKVETVRNCAALPRDFVEAVVLEVATALLNMTAQDSHTGNWNPGGSLSVGEVAALLGSQTLQQLKKECGGLQTLLKNSYQVFRVEGGRVHIRDWREGKSCRTKTKTKRRPAAAGATKTRPCWFYQHHPQRCPLLAEHCVFAHGADDLRASTRPLKKIRNDS